MSKTFKERSEDEVLFIDIFDLSIIELTTLTHLLTLENKILRYNLYKEVNSLLTPFKKLSTSSFYNSLQKLNKRKLIKFENIDNKDPKSLAVFKTEKTDKVIGFMFYYFTQYQLSSNQNRFQPLEIFKQLTGKNNFDNVMVIDPEKRTGIKLISSIIPSAVDTLKDLAKVSKGVSLLSTKDLYEYYINQGVDNVISSTVVNEVVREPDNFFDLIVYPMYDRDIAEQEMESDNILEEVKRILTPGGKIIILHLEKIVGNNHYLLQHFLGTLKKSGYFNPPTSEYFIERLNSKGFKDLEKYVSDGISYICGKLY